MIEVSQFWPRTKQARCTGSNRLHSRDVTDCGLLCCLHCATLVMASSSESESDDFSENSSDCGRVLDEEAAGDFSEGHGSVSDTDDMAGPLQQMELQGIEPYRFEPPVSDVDSTASDTDSEEDGGAYGPEPVAQDIDRLQNTEW